MIPPTTPPRRTVALEPVTPSSSRCHKKNSRLKPVASPFLTPRSSRKHASDIIGPSPKQAQHNFLPTPLTVGSGRKGRNPVLPAQTSLKSRNLTATLQALSENHLVKEQQPSTPPRPSTPQEQIIREPSTPYSAGLGIYDIDDDDTDKVRVVDVDFLKHIPRKKLPNPFLESHPSRLKKQPSKIDLATQMELVNHRTGERKVEQLLEEQRRFKPRRLEFTPAENPVKINYNIANKFVGKNMGKAFTMEDSNKLGFSIFSDGDSSS